MMNEKNRIEKALEYVRGQIGDKRITFGIILGSGLGALAYEIEDAIEIPFDQIPSFPEATVKGHSGRLIVGEVGGKSVVAVAGRLHYYEGHDIKNVVFPIRLLALLGIEGLIVSNASGGIQPGMEVGDIMVIEDQINMQPVNPLRGENVDEWGSRFPDMLHAFDVEWAETIHKIASENDLSLKRGTYMGVPGPTFETPAEYKAYHIMGGDAIGMSTVPEIVVARHMGLRVLALSVIADIGYPTELMEEVSHDIVLEKASEATPKVVHIVKKFLEKV